MNFLKWWNPLTWGEDILGAIIGGVQAALNSVLYFIATVVNKVIIYMYGVFNVLCSSRLLDSDIIAELTKRISLLLGILMFFIVIFNCVQYVLDPDKLTDNEKGVGNIVKKILIVIVMLGFSGTAFNMLYSVQNTVINSNIISKLLLPYDIDTDNFGGVLSANLFTSFYRINDQLDLENDPDINNDVRACSESREVLKNNIIMYEDFELGNNCLNQKVDIVQEGTGWFGSDLFAEVEKINIIDFNGIFLVIFSCGVLYFLFGYCISVGVRSIQLAFLEILSPVAIIGYLLPSKDNIFNKWLKIYISTYVDVFLRIAIINFAVYLIAVIFSEGSMPEGWQELNTGTFIFVQVLMIMAILTFAKKAPELLKDLFPTGASKLGLGFENAKKGLGMAAIGAGATLGTGIAFQAAASRYKANREIGNGRIKALRSALGGGAVAAARGFKAGAKKGNPIKNVNAGIKRQRELDNDYATMIASGGSTWGKFQSKVVDTFSETAGQRATRQMRDIAKLAEHKKNVNTIAADSKEVNAAKTAYENMVQWLGESIEDFNARKQQANQYWRDLRNAFIDSAVNGFDEIKDANGQVVGHSYSIKDSKGNIVTYEIDDDDMARGTQIKSEIKQANDYSISHKVQYYNNATETMEYVGEITDRKSLGATERYSMETNTHFAEGKYQKAMANDRAAGVAGKEKK